MPTNSTNSSPRMASRTTPASDQFREVFVKNLDRYHDSEAKVRQLFKSCGTVVSVRLVKNEKGLLVGVAFVRFAEHSMALEACRRMNNLLTNNGQRLYVDRAFTKNEWEKRKEKERHTGIFRIIIKNLPRRVDDEMLYRRFSRFGRIMAYKVAVNEDDHYPLGHGYITFLSQGAADRAIKEVDGMPWYGKDIIVEKFVPIGERKQFVPKNTNGRKLFIRGDDMDDTVLYELFHIYGQIEDIVVKYSKGIAFVTYKDKSMADKALANQGLIKRMLPGREVTVELALPESPKKVAADDFECQICFQKRWHEDAVNYGCVHQFCYHCIAYFLECLIESGVTTLKCPEESCKQGISDYLIARLVPPHVFERYLLWKNGGAAYEGSPQATPAGFHSRLGGNFVEKKDPSGEPKITGKTFFGHRCG